MKSLTVSSVRRRKLSRVAARMRRLAPFGLAASVCLCGGAAMAASEPLGADRPFACSGYTERGDRIGIVFETAAWEFRECPCLQVRATKDGDPWFSERAAAGLSEHTPEGKTYRLSALSTPPTTAGAPDRGSGTAPRFDWTVRFDYFTGSVTGALTIDGSPVQKLACEMAPARKLERLDEVFKGTQGEEKIVSWLEANPQDADLALAALELANGASAATARETDPRFSHPGRLFAHARDLIAKSDLSDSESLLRARRLIELLWDSPLPDETVLLALKELQDRGLREEVAARALGGARAPGRDSTALRAALAEAPSTSPDDYRQLLFRHEGDCRQESRLHVLVAHPDLNTPQGTRFARLSLYLFEDGSYVVEYGERADWKTDAPELGRLALKGLWRAVGSRLYLDDLGEGVSADGPWGPGIYLTFSRDLISPGLKGRGETLQASLVRMPGRQNACSFLSSLESFRARPVDAGQAPANEGPAERGTEGAGPDAFL